MLARFSPTKETTVHDHSSWGVVSVVNGHDRYRHGEAGEGGRLQLL